ncbi:MAG: dual specificity protein phosphatase family protein [Pseudomonadota bacterium]|nr:dual specificity protein phosphatase family protein [Pseudomonadota bacterium]
MRAVVLHAAGRFCCALFVASLSVGASAAHSDQPAQRLNVKGLSNLYRVSPTLYRGAMPDTAGFDALEEMPIASVLSLRWQADPADATPEDGPRRLHIPIRTWDLEEAHVVEFLQLASDPANQPMLVHCKHGADRTGTMIAAYRIVVQGWSKEEALAEMKTKQFGHHWMWKNLRRFVLNMDIERIRLSAGLGAIAQHDATVAVAESTR